MDDYIVNFMDFPTKLKVGEPSSERTEHVEREETLDCFPLFPKMKPKPKKPLDPSQPHLLCLSLLASHSFAQNPLLFSLKPLFIP